MLVALGFFLAALIGFLAAPLYRRRAARLATDELKRTMPLTAAEIRADKDRLRAEYAITIHGLETKVDEATQTAAKQRVEINRRDAAISGLEGEAAQLRTALEEHENARRVLEHTITDRLPKVEHRLAEAKKLLFQRDREIAGITQSATKQAEALEEATQINTQQRDEIHRLNATLAARAARNRESLGDPRFDGEVALRAELEALRTKARDQASLISRLQGALVQSGVRPDSIGGYAPGRNGERGSDGGAMDAELGRLRKDLAETELALKSARGVAEAGQAGQALHEADLRALKAANQDQAAEIAKLKAGLKAYEAEDSDDRAVKESKIALKARLSAVQAQADQQVTTIQSLRAEIAAANEKLARQAAHFMDEMRRLGAGTVPASGPSRRDSYEKSQKRSLVERIKAPRPLAAGAKDGTGKSAAAAKAKQDPSRVTGFLRALDGSPSGGAAGATATETAGEAAAQSAPQKGRRPSLLERITGLDKPAATGG